MKITLRHGVTQHENDARHDVAQENNVPSRRDPGRKLKLALRHDVTQHVWK